MSDRPVFANPRVHVIMSDGAEWDAQTLNPDLLQFELTAGKHKWAGPADAPMRWLTFLAWKAGLREGHIPTSVTWEAFSTELCLQVSNPGDTAVDPTQPAPALD